MTSTPSSQSISLPLSTSEADPIRVDFLPPSVVGLPGPLGMTIAPGKCNVGLHILWQRNLEQDLRRLRDDYHTDRLITLLQAHEFKDLQIPHLLQTVQQYGMESTWFPIEDFGTPVSPWELLDLVHSILETANQGHTTVIHCKAGLGRTGLVTASCLVALGYTPDEAFAQVRASRTGSVETPDQEAFVREFAMVLKHQ